MQRIAWLAAGCVVLVALAGCDSTGDRKMASRPPEPVLSTRPPDAIIPIPRPTPPKAAPSPRLEPGAVRLADILPRGGIQRGRWKVIVVHHAAANNATPQGMDSWHRQRGWEGGLGYHFVIGNGVNFPDGQLYVGPRWRSQSTGAHCKNAAGRYMGVFRPKNFFNEQGIGICLIGDFQSSRPTAKQLRTLRDLTALLVNQTGIDPGLVYGHGEVTHKTACPGRNMNMGALRQAVASAAGRGNRAASLVEPWLDEPPIILAADEDDCDAPCCAGGEADLLDGDVHAINYVH